MYIKGEVPEIKQLLNFKIHRSRDIVINQKRSISKT